MSYGPDSYRCENCGQWFTADPAEQSQPLYCPGCEDYIKMRREEEWAELGEAGA